MRRLSAALCGLSCALLVGAGVALAPQPPLCEGLNHTELYRINQKYGLESPVEAPLRQFLDALSKGGWGFSPPSRPTPT